MQNTILFLILFAFTADAYTKVGGIEEIDVNDQKVLELLKNSLSNLETGNDGNLEIVEIQKITRQVVSGVRYIVVGTFKTPNGIEEICTVTIFLQPRRSADNITEAVCESKTYQTKN